MRDLAFGGIFLILAALAIIKPWAGIVLWTWVSFMNPHRLCYGFLSSAPLALIGGSIAILSFLIFQRPKRMVWRLEVVLFMVLMLWMTFTTCVGLNPGPGWVYWNQVMKIDLMVLLTI